MAKVKVYGKKMRLSTLVAKMKKLGLDTSRIEKINKINDYVYALRQGRKQVTC